MKRLSKITKFTTSKSDRCCVQASQVYPPHTRVVRECLHVSKMLGPHRAMICRVLIAWLIETVASSGCTAIVSDERLDGACTILRGLFFTRLLLSRSSVFCVVATLLQRRSNGDVGNRDLNRGTVESLEDHQVVDRPAYTWEIYNSFMRLAQIKSIGRTMSNLTIRFRQQEE